MMIDDESLQKLYTWVDEIKLSRPKRNMARDFSDGVLTAEILHFYFPKLVQLHNYTPANSVQQKLYNWNTLNQKVFRKLCYQAPKTLVEDIVRSKPGAIEECLIKLQHKIATYKERKPSVQVESAADDDGRRPASPPAASMEPTGSSFDPHLSPSPTDRKKYDVNEIHDQVDRDILVEKEMLVQEQRETIQILEQKIQKLEQLVRLKDGKIQTLVAKLKSVDRK